jgi:hypothetical protein
MSTQREIFGDPGFGDNDAGILGANRSLGWSPIPMDAPEWVKQRVADTRSYILGGRETRSTFTQHASAPQSALDRTIAEAREICRKNGITHFLDGDVDDDAAVVTRRRNLLNALMS